MELKGIKIESLKRQIGVGTSTATDNLHIEYKLTPGWSLMKKSFQKAIDKMPNNYLSN